MATRYRRRLYGNYYRSGYRRTYGSKTRKRAIGNYRAAVQQKDATQVNLNVMHKCSTGYFKKTLNGVSKNTGVYALNIWDLLRRSEFYQSYASMYDQVKIDRIKIKLTPINWTFDTQTGGMKAITIVTAWDRSGLSQEQVVINGKPSEFAANNVIGTDEDSDGLYVTMNDDICTYSSAQTRNLNPGSSLSISRFLYPSSMQEKSQYINTADLKEWYEKYDSINGRYYGIPLAGWVIGNPANIGESIVDSNVIIGAVEDTNAVKNNPCYLLEDSGVSFKPTLLIGCQTNSELANHDVQENVILENPVTFNLEADIVCTFRGLRKATIVA